jgi:hypothetical protein
VFCFRVSSQECVRMCGSLAISGTVVEEKEEEACPFSPVCCDRQGNRDRIVASSRPPSSFFSSSFFPLLDLATQQHHTSLDSPSDSPVLDSAISPLNQVSSPSLTTPLLSSPPQHLHKLSLLLCILGLSIHSPFFFL